MLVIRKRPSGDTVTSRWEPFQLSVSGASAVFGNQSEAPL